MNFWNALRFAVVAVLDTLLSLFPNADTAVLAKITEQLAPLKSTVLSAGWFFPVHDFFTTLGLIFTIETAVSLYKFVKFILKNVSLGFIRD